MQPKRKQRLILICVLVIGVAIAVSLILFALKQNINLFYTPSQVVNSEAPKTHTFRIGGLVRIGSVQRDKNSLNVSFILTDTANDVKVHYHGILPDLFREGQGIVAQGRLAGQNLFEASEVLAKHDEKYMPPPVAAAIKSAANSKKPSS